MRSMKITIMIWSIFTDTAIRMTMTIITAMSITRITQKQPDIIMIRCRRK